MKRTTTTFTVGHLYQLNKHAQLVLQPEFQRYSVWPTKAKAYFVDTVLNHRPVPLLFLQRARSVNSGRITYYVVDGQQRLRALIDFIDGKFPLLKSEGRLRDKFFADLPQSTQHDFLSAGLIVEELIDYSDKDIRNIFERMNKYVVRANPQEIRHATKPGVFKDFVEALAKLAFWSSHDIFTPAQRRRMKPQELCAELAILVVEGPQDKKASVDLYYEAYSPKFPDAKRVKRKLDEYLKWISKNIPDIRSTFLRKPIDFYSLIGALHEFRSKRSTLPKVIPSLLSQRLQKFGQQIRAKPPTGQAARYAEAASRQTDNLHPREVRIEIISKLLVDRL